MPFSGLQSFLQWMSWIGSVSGFQRQISDIYVKYSTNRQFLLSFLCSAEKHWIFWVLQNLNNALNNFYSEQTTIIYMLPDKLISFIYFHQIIHHFCKYPEPRQVHPSTMMTQLWQITHFNLSLIIPDILRYTSSLVPLTRGFLRHLNISSIISTFLIPFYIRLNISARVIHQAHLSIGYSGYVRHKAGKITYTFSVISQLRPPWSFTSITLYNPCKCI